MLPFGGIFIWERCQLPLAQSKKKGMKLLKWGIIGCGDVTEVKSGPAFSKIEHSDLLAVMRRDAVKAKDYAVRHNVPFWYSTLDDLLSNQEINAIYIATPPSSHEVICQQVIRSRRPVYVEKPMAMNANEARQMLKSATDNNIPLTIAHYRRQQPKFLKIKSLLKEKAIGEVRSVDLVFARELVSPEALTDESKKWRVDPSVSGGGLFHDMAPHQLDLMLYFFGQAADISGNTEITQDIYNAPDLVNASMNFAGKIEFTGYWNFNSAKDEDSDIIIIRGTDGEINFSVFDDNLVFLKKDGKCEEFSFPALTHVQQPMIAAVCKYFLGEGENPCTGEDGVTIMEWMDFITDPTHSTL